MRRCYIEVGSIQLESAAMNWIGRQSGEGRSNPPRVALYFGQWRLESIHVVYSIHPTHASSIGNVWEQSEKSNPSALRMSVACGSLADRLHNVARAPPSDL